MRRRTIQHLGAVATATAIATLAAAAQGPWAKKEWKTWSQADCQAILTNSPWAQTTYWTKDGRPAHNDGGGGEYYMYTSAQLYSALPIRQALARQGQIQNGYDKMDGEQRQVFDSKTNADLTQTYSDRIVVHVVSGGYDTKYSSSPHVAVARQAFLIFPNGKNIPAIRTTAPQNNAHSEEFEVFFPRIDAGRTVVKPGDNKVTFVLGILAGSEFRIQRSFEFNVDKMMYQGKFEF